MNNKHLKTVVTHYPKASGLTLMEVLASVIILSIGLLGVASLQFNSLRGNQNAMEASAAIALAAEAADRIRANSKGANDGDYDFIDVAGTDPGCINTLCSVAEVAQTDAYEWITRLGNLLPNGEGVICRDSTPMDGVGVNNNVDPMCDGASDIFAIKVFWDHDKDPNTTMISYRTVLLLPRGKP